jgi:hypothetical protein
MRTEIGLPISNILFKSWHLIVISFFMLSSLLDRNLLPKEFLNLKRAFSANKALGTGSLETPLQPEIKAATNKPAPIFRK